jgi:hypothetical protein
MILNHYTLRQRFESQFIIGLPQVADVKIPTKSRDELAPTLAGLQHIFITPELNEQVFAIVEKKIPTGSDNFIGREGMTLWEILVLAVCRLTLNANYDRMHDMANHHSLIRSIMQVSTNSFTGEDPSYGLQTIKENLMLLDEETIMEINELVVASAHHLVLKKNEKLQIKSDTFVLETNVHFPTDYNLLYDSARKSLDIMCLCSIKYQFDGWRKVKSWKSQLKSLSRSLGKACAGKGVNKDKQINLATQEYLAKARELEVKINASIDENWLKISSNYTLELLITNDLVFFMSMLAKHIDLVERRLLKKETIASSEKIYSIFETHTEWKSKGKVNKPVELGHNILISTDQHGFILHSKVVNKLPDNQLVISLADEMLAKYKIHSWSFDKGFYSKENKTLLKTEIPHVVMPKKGKLNAEEKVEESAKKFKMLRNAHSAVESNINSLEHHGLDRCPDKGLKRFKTYVSIAILSYNLHKLGKILLARQASQEQEFRQVA